MNPDATSFSETLSTLKFAERVSGVELGAAKSNKDNKDSYELMDQVLYLHTSNTILHCELMKQNVMVGVGDNSDREFSQEGWGDRGAAEASGEKKGHRSLK